MYRYLFSFLIAFSLSGCSESGRTMILSAPTQRYAVNTYTLEHGRSTIPCDDEVKEQFEAEIREGLSEMNMRQGNDLIIAYRCVQCEEGNRFVRCLSGVQAELTMEVIFKDKNKKELSKIYVSGKNSSGFFKGSFNYAVDKAAKQVIQYVSHHFHQ